MPERMRPARKKMRKELGMIAGQEQVERNPPFLDRRAIGTMPSYSNYIARLDHHDTSREGSKALLERERVQIVEESRTELAMMITIAHDRHEDRFTRQAQRVDSDGHTHDRIRCTGVEAVTERFKHPVSPVTMRQIQVGHNDVEEVVVPMRAVNEIERLPCRLYDREIVIRQRPAS